MRLRWLVAAVLALMAAAWYFRGAMTPARPGVRVIAERSTAAPTITAAPAARRAAALSGAAGSAAAPDAMEAILRSLPPGWRRAKSPGVWDLCGVGRVPHPPGAEQVDRELPDHLMSEPLVRARQRLLQALDAGDNRARAAAAMLRSGYALIDGQATRPLPLPPLAGSGSDPLIASWSARDCLGRAECSGTQALADWLRQEPDNAAPWLVMLARKPSQRAQAIDGLARARYFNSHSGALAAVVMAAMPADVPGYLEVMLDQQALFIDFASDNVAALATQQACPPREAPAPGVGPVCNILAHAMAEEGDTLLVRKIGLALGARVGWPAEQLRARRAALEAVQSGAGGATGIDLEQPMSCDSLEGLRHWIAALGKGGEYAALQAAAASQPAR